MEDLEISLFDWAAESQARLSTKPGRWNGSPSSNCLPLSLAALDVVRGKFPHANIVVGDIGIGSVPSNTKAIAAFMSGGPEPVFHAWIEWPTACFLDLVGPSWLERVDRELGNNRFFWHGHLPLDVKYHRALSDEKEVKRFYTALCKARNKVADWDGDCFRK